MSNTTSRAGWAKLEKRFTSNYEGLLNRVMGGEEMELRHGLEYDGNRSQAELAAQAGRETAQRRAEDAGLPHTMTAQQALRAMRAGLKANTGA